MLSFALGSTDLPNNLTRAFTDSANNTATYTGTLPSHSSIDLPPPFALTLASFANATSVDRNAVECTSFSGGNASGVDHRMPADAPGTSAKHRTMECGFAPPAQKE